MTLQKPQPPVYVVDDDEAVRRSLLMLLFPQGLAVQGFASGEDFLAGVDLQQPACVVLDLRMGGLSGLQVFERMRQVRSPQVVLFLSGHGDIPMALDAVRQGAFDWVVKPDTAVLLAKLPLALAEAGERGDALALWAQLTPREREVARHVAVGASNKAIARTLVPECSPRSVETHRANLFAKLGVANDNALGRWMARFESMLA
ncbi:response regulator transcription factor [Ideonella margarita]|jgi:two-component system response regulator TtrR|uniref:Response regulator n=1 Tax=Ideonella margarita TaxID=2984191 RepID=A0ABU9C358_9BURK